ncbi:MULTISPECIES: Na+/H+ antiporter subunit C [Aureimonas]|jgi:multicomponent Na+:H+ antiporter subunit C|uniref:Multicomponent Na+:H+ antiporter subunit C n=1 Tax=Aureimonas phyllosphaerae TaxID=1166078 RepID=A0A7W6FU13_9HYPH|nr:MULTISPECIES: Na+/H+ antiporter subunit C [Aureimonas]KQQ81825.1 cation:proton antiporter [Aureimonas sp. Leaf324]MBB3935596.1 multicomponent Na+:H+ antiporter subunit C [Aureimonas phyllosphaerae]MBB3959604.1 multicomponent Na+:H+ antiporter subunit C [Aureimonas phyllosphaerae]SFF12762.1 multisubunit sodium/proton antiporter, MrpC subunit [Aureimonas phyllosphaerae]
MEIALAGLVAVMFSVTIYLLLSRYIIRMLLGVVLLGNSVNLSLFVAGRISPIAPPLIPAGLKVPPQDIANPVPQALVLTAIVISFSFFVFLLVLAYRAYQDLETDDTMEMRVAEPEDEGLPPLGY